MIVTTLKNHYDWTEGMFIVPLDIDALSFVD